GLGGAAAEALEEVLERWRDQEDQQGTGDLALDHLCALDVDLQDHVAASGETLADLVARRAVPGAVDLVRLEEAARRALSGEGLRVHEVVVDAVDLAGPGGARRAGH